MTTDDNNDADLFAQAVGDVKPIHHNLAEPVRGLKTPGAVQAPSVDSSLEFGEELRYFRPGIQSSVLQKLRRGQPPIEAIVDLHGLTVPEASERLQHFLNQSRAAGRNAVRIIHGKGFGSEGRQPVLKTKVHQWLQEFPFVLAFCSAKPNEGGTGAVDVLLQKAKMVR